MLTNISRNCLVPFPNLPIVCRSTPVGGFARCDSQWRHLVLITQARYLAYNFQVQQGAMAFPGLSPTAPSRPSPPGICLSTQRVRETRTLRANKHADGYILLLQCTKVLKHARSNVITAEIKWLCFLGHRRELATEVSIHPKLVCKIHRKYAAPQYLSHLPRPIAQLETLHHSLLQRSP